MNSTTEHWGKWLQLRSRVIGFSGQSELARAVGCNRERIAKWMSMKQPPLKMRKDFDKKLAQALQTTVEMLLKDWRKIPPEKAPEVRELVDLSSVPYHDLMVEVAARWRKKRDEVLKWMDEALVINWEKVSGKHNSGNADEPVVTLIGTSIAVEDLSWKFDGAKFSRRRLGPVPGFQIYYETGEANEVALRARELLNKPGYKNAVTRLIEVNAATKHIRILEEFASQKP